MSDYITVEQLKASLEMGSSYADQDVQAAVSSASRAVDKYCRRRFWKDDDANQVRYYSPDRQTWQGIHDIVTLTSVETDPAGDGTFPDSWTLNTDYTLEPLNAAEDDEPYTTIRVHPNGTFWLPTGFPRSLKITAMFGWPDVPDEVPAATTIIASKLVKRIREAPFGIVSTGVDGFAARISRNDPDVYNLLGPLRRHPIAVA